MAEQRGGEPVGGAGVGAAPRPGDGLEILQARVDGGVDTGHDLVALAGGGGGPQDRD